MYNLIFLVTQTILGSYSTLPACEKAMKDHALYAITGPAIKPTPEIERAVEIQLKYTTKYQCLKVDNKSVR